MHVNCLVVACMCITCIFYIYLSTPPSSYTLLLLSASTIAVLLCLKHFKIVSACLTFLCWYMLAILFGATLFDDVMSTAAFAAVCTALTGQTFGDIFSSGCSTRLRDDASVFGCAIGACCGAYALPLDWGTQWQVWPMPCVFVCVGRDVLPMCR